MPLPIPNAGEEQEEFVARCMSSPTTSAEFPDVAQRRAVCQSQWVRGVSKSIILTLEKDALSDKYLNILPDEAFAYIEPGSNLRHFPLHDKEHVRKALTRLDQTAIGPAAKKEALVKIVAAAKKFGIKVSRRRADEIRKYVEKIKVSKPDAGYSCPASSRLKRCGTCANFDGEASCSVVAGKISADCVSNKWIPKR
jgi:hypothetical protein